MREQEITIIGGGLAGCEAAWQVARRGIPVRLHEMKPDRYSPAHSMPGLAELVCSNSLRSDDPHSAVGLLKEEMRRLGSLLMEAAEATKVPAGKALAVDRSRFAAWITERIERHEKITVCRGEIEKIPPPGNGPIILATGPLTSSALAASLAELTGDEHLAFYDAIAPIIAAESLDRSIIFQASRYDDGPGDYLNCPMSEEEYTNFISALKEAQTVPLKSFEEQKYFEGCLPIEVMVARGDETLRFGPMKPVGLPDPRTGYEAHAVVQLRKENLEGSHYNMVGFQTKLTYPEQKRIFRMIPGMANAEFERLGSIHRNTFICAPKVLRPTLQCDKRPDLLLAGQLTGVEGYVESTAMGLLAGINGARIASGQEPVVPPPATALGALVSHLTNTECKHFQPSNVNFGLFPPITGKKMPKRLRGEYRATQALELLAQWQQAASISVA
ncbi:MAG: methylenetetrahydrofolate--tRNA-(uracil(54)-C(5))-methyltransferase (FADH(2)-oxidizing) TrmFO [Desulfobulbaceae bacterium]|nr:methylenetetrahydrofolate--tRNA-(uracil(54)-C(5))-methyltransferase (FADH(2)-oxidizing) TrmFO [Desulfobulbaceae bacterium]